MHEFDELCKVYSFSWSSISALLSMSEKSIKAMRRQRAHVKTTSFEPKEISVCSSMMILLSTTDDRHLPCPEARMFLNRSEFILIIKVRRHLH